MTPAPSGSQRLAIWCAASAAFLTSLDGSVVSVSLPAMSREFSSDMGTATWVSAGYMIALSCALIPSGRLLDRFGPWRFFSWGFMAFALTSAVCAVSSSMLSLVLLRCLQGLSAGMLVVSAFAVIPRAVPEASQAGAFATLTVVASMGLSIGGPVGGLLSEYASWRWVFLINLPIGLAAAWLSHRFASSAGEETNLVAKPIDLVASAAGMLMLGAALIGLNRGDEWGWGSPRTIGTVLCSVLAGVLFLKRERSAPSPLVAWDAISSPVIRRGFSLAALAYLYLSGLQLLIPFDLVGYRHFSTSAVGGVMLAYSLPLMGAGALSGKVSRRIGLQWSQALAMGLVITGSLLLALAPGSLLLLSMACCGVGFGLFCSPNNAAVMGAAAPGEQGRVAGTFQTVSRISIAAGPVLFEALHNQFERIHRCDGEAVAEALAFRTSYLSGAALCLLVALLALCQRPGTATALGRRG